jgi:hypothetical protein
MQATMLKNKVMYGQFIHSVAFVNYNRCTRLRPLYLYFPDTSRFTRPQLRAQAITASLLYLL